MWQIWPPRGGKKTAAAVEADEREKGVRAVLNYGHTFAHVIENETNYKKYLHGEAVAIGMNMASVSAGRNRFIRVHQKSNGLE